MDFPCARERRKPKIRTTPKLITAQNFDLCSLCSAGAPSLWASYFFTCVSVCPAWGQGHSVLERGCSGEGCLRGLSRWMGEFWGLVSAPEAASAFYLQIGSMQNAEAVQETEGNASPPPPPPGCVCKALSPLSVCFCQTGACWHYLLILLHSVAVSTGGGDSPPLIRAGPSLLLVGHFFKGEGGVGLALPVWWKAENLGRLFVRRALQNPLVTQALGDISRITIAACRGARFVPVCCQGSGGKRSLHPRLAGEVALLASDCRAGLRTRNKVEEGKVCEQCPSNT